MYLFDFALPNAVCMRNKKRNTKNVIAVSFSVFFHFICLFFFSFRYKEPKNISPNVWSLLPAVRFVGFMCSYICKLLASLPFLWHLSLFPIIYFASVLLCTEKYLTDTFLRVQMLVCSQAND